MAREDRFGRGSDQSSFTKQGFPAVVFRESNENFEKQHSANDTLDGVDFAYLAQNARVNAAARQRSHWHRQRRRWSVRMGVRASRGFLQAMTRICSGARHRAQLHIASTGATRRPLTGNDRKRSAT
jgi:hypothetical protein